MTDLLSRLRDWQDYEPAKMFGGEILKDVEEAAAEIERLTALVEEACKTLDRYGLSENAYLIRQRLGADEQKARQEKP